MATMAMAAYCRSNFPATEHGWVVYVETPGFIWWIIIGLLAGWIAGTSRAAVGLAALRT